MQALDEVFEAAQEDGSLDLSYRAIKTFDETILSLGKVLTKINMSYNKLPNLPEGIDCLLRLEEFNLENNLLSSLPETIGNLTHLKKLNLNSNKLSNFPVETTQCFVLQELSLDNNYITKIPQEIAALKLLTTFSVKNNQLEVIPCELCKCVSLLTVDFTGNKELVNMPVSCLKDSRVLLYILGQLYIRQEEVRKYKRALEANEQQLHRCQALNNVQDLKIEKLQARISELSKLVPWRYLLIKKFISRILDRLCCLKLRVFAEQV